MSTHVITSRFPPVCCCISDNRWSRAALQRDTGRDKSDIPRTVSETSFRSCLVCATQFTSTYRGFRWFSFNTSRPSCLLPREVERCTDNARAFSGVIKGLNPRSFVRRMTLILSTREPATEQAINSSAAFRLHDRLAQISSATMQRMQFACSKMKSSSVYMYIYIVCVGGGRVGVVCGCV